MQLKSNKTFKGNFFVFFVTLFLSLLCYWPSLHFYFIADSLEGAVLGFRDVRKELTNAGFVLGYRPLGVGWFALNNALFDHIATGHRVLALLIHATNGLLVFLITEKLFQNKITPALAALIFITSPGQVETVVWLAAFAGSGVSTFFFLLSLWVWIGATGFPTFILRLLSALFFLLALFTKEISVFLPLAMVLMDWFLNRFTLASLWKKRMSYFKRYSLHLTVLLIYFTAYYFTGALQFSAGETGKVMPGTLQPILERFDRFAFDLFLPVSGFIEFRTGEINWLWLILLFAFPLISRKNIIPFILLIISLFPGIFYYGERMLYLPNVFFSIIVANTLMHFVLLTRRRFANLSFVKPGTSVLLILITVLLLVVNYRFIQRKIQPWEHASYLCRTIPEKVHELLPDPAPGSQIILADMTYHTGFQYTLWAIFREVMRYYPEGKVNISQIHQGPDVDGLLINKNSISCKSDHPRYFIKYFPEADRVGFVTPKEMGIDCP